MKMKIGDVYYEKHTVVSLSPRTGDVFECDVEIINDISSEHKKCKDCKWWKESDGTFARSCRAESKCPINTKTVYEGEGYCYMFEPQESEG